MTGDQDDVSSRLLSYLPDKWFGDEPNIVTGTLAAAAYAFSWIYGLIGYAKNQCRIKTASDGWLDMAANDYFGLSLLRQSNQSDASFRARILINLVRERGTRNAIIKVLTDLTGQAPIVFEPWRVQDTGAMNSPKSSGYCGVARMGSMGVPYTAMITAHRAKISGGSAGGAYMNAPKQSALNTPLASSYTNSLTYQQSAASDADLYAAVDSVKPAGTTMWVALTA